MTVPSFFRSMAVRIFLLLAVGMSAAASVGFFISDQDRRQLVDRHYQDQVAARIVDVVVRLSDERGGDAIAPVPPGVVDRAVPVSGHDIDLDVTTVLNDRLAGTTFGELRVFKPLAGDCLPLPPVAAEARPAPPLPPSGAPAAAGPPRPRPAVVGPDCRLVSFVRHDGSQRVVVVPVPPRPEAGAQPFDVILFYVLIGAAIVLAVVVSIWATAPLRALVRAATRLGEDLNQPPLDTRGPSEVRRAAEAFNLMQAQIRKALEDKTFLLAAITHDLQTPLTRQRLRIESLDDPVLRDQMLDDYRAMRDLIHDGLEIARGSATGGEWVPVDLPSLLESIRDDAVAAGLNVSIEESVDLIVLADPMSIRRCMLNLVENAVKYGRRARISARPVGDRVEVAVVDDGPGIEPDKLGSVVQPFVRLDQGEATLGTGLGLAIARLLAERNGSDLVLENLNGGGLRVSIRLAVALPGQDGKAP